MKHFPWSFPCFLWFCLLSGASAAKVSLPGDDLQAVLDRGEDLALEKGALYEIRQTLRYRKPGQKIFTKGAEFPSDYATLRLANKDLMMLIHGGGQEGAVLERVICDGDRYRLSTVPKGRGSGGAGQPALVHFGGPGGDGQIVRNCVFMNTRTWSTLKMHEHASNMLTENNLFFGMGVDPRGNGREFNEIPFSWADGVSSAATDSIIRNNLLIDPTDVGIVLYCAPGSIVEDNVVAAISRESLGGINLVDALLEMFALDEDLTLFDYGGVVVRNNYIDNFGARIHMGIPVGCAVWHPRFKGRILQGGSVTGNTIAGGAGGYGIVAHGLKGWTIQDNLSTAHYSGLAEYGFHPNPPDPPAAFLFHAESVLESELQPEFQETVRHIDHLLRTQKAPQNEFGYQMHDYGHEEIQAVVQAAYLEMLGRDPTREELLAAADLLQSRQRNADGLRRQLMGTPEFEEKFGFHFPAELHPFRVQRWFDLCDQLLREKGEMYPMRELYQDALQRLRLPAK
ncbi:MAG: hypothetical protein AAF555_03725 [Verrucomicrobiota bacterium]